MTKKFLYPELKPKVRFEKILENHVIPQLELDGFKLLKSGPSLKSKVENFEWLVEFNGQRYNEGNFVCRFNPYFTVRNNTFRKYLRQKYSDPTGTIQSTQGKHHWKKRFFTNNNSPVYFIEDNDFAKYDNEKLVDEMVTHIRNVGIPFFKMLSNLDSIIEHSITCGFTNNAPSLIDLCYALNREDAIEKIFKWYDKKPIEHLQNEMNEYRKNWLQQRL